MAYEDKVRPGAKPQRITMEERARLTVTGVEEVLSFDTERIVMRTVLGELTVTGRSAGGVIRELTVTGSDLHVGKLSLDTGELAVEGLVSDLSYAEQSVGGGFWSRLFG